MSFTQRVSRLAAASILLFSAQAHSQQKSGEVTESTAQSLVGRWDLTLKAPDREYPSWLEITQENQQLKARMVSRWGHARPLPKFELLPGGAITFVSPKEEEDRKEDMVFRENWSGRRCKEPRRGKMELRGNGRA